MTSFPDIAATARPWRTVIEGFYGPPWTLRQRLDPLAFRARHDVTASDLGRKDDPYHRCRWRGPYPPGFVAALRLGWTCARTTRAVGRHR